MSNTLGYTRITVPCKKELNDVPAIIKVGGKLLDEHLKELKEKSGQGGTSFEDLGYEQFSAAETYAAGDVVIYGGKLYEFTASHSGTWTGTDAKPTSVAESVEEGKHPYISLERLRKYLYRVTFDKLPADNGGDNPVSGGCSSFVQDGKLYRNLDFKYDNAASFIVRTKNFEGMSFITGLNDGELTDELIAQLPYRVVDGINNYGIKVSTHVLFNDWEWAGAGEKSISLTRLPYLVLTMVKSMATISTDLADVLGNLAQTEAMGEYLLQVLVTDGTTTYAILPPTSANSPYVIQDITSNPKLTNFRWLAQDEVSRTDADLQSRPTGIERFNLMPCNLSELRFTKAYEAPTRLSEFIGIDGTTKASADEELEAIYDEARAAYLDRERDGVTWQTMHSVVYGEKMESLWIQENWNDNVIPASAEALEETQDNVDVHTEMLGDLPTWTERSAAQGGGSDRAYAEGKYLLHDWTDPTTQVTSKYVYRVVSTIDVGDAWNEQSAVKTSVFNELDTLLVGEEEVVHLHVTSDDGLAGVAGLSVTVRFEDGGNDLIVVTDETGDAIFSIAKGRFFTLIMPTIQGYGNIPDERLKATSNARYVTKTYENVVAVNTSTITVTFTAEGKSTTKANGKNAVLTYDGIYNIAVVSNGSATFTGIPFGKTCKIVYPILFGYLVAEAATVVTDTASIALTANYKKLPTEILLLMDNGEEKAYEDWDKNTETPVAFHFSTSQLSKEGCDFYIKISDLATFVTDEYKFEFTVPSTNITNLPIASDNTLDGQQYTQIAIDYAESHEGVTVPAASFAASQTLDVRGNTARGFLMSNNQASVSIVENGIGLMLVVVKEIYSVNTILEMYNIGIRLSTRSDSTYTSAITRSGGDFRMGLDSPYGRNYKMFVIPAYGFNYEMN